MDTNEIVDKTLAAVRGNDAAIQQVSMARVSRQNGAHSLAGALSAAVATPVLAVLEALRSDYGIANDDARMQAVGEATLLLYVYGGLTFAKTSLLQAEREALDLGAHNLAAVARNRAEYVDSVQYRLFAPELGVSRL